MSITSAQVQSLAGGSGKVYAGSDKVGSIGQIYLDDATGEPSWVTVKTGLFGTGESFVPLQGARVDGDDLVVNVSEAQIKDAPRIDPDGRISPDEEDELYRYYGLSDSGVTDRDVTSGTGTTGYADTANRDLSDRDVSDRDVSDRDVSDRDLSDRDVSDRDVSDRDVSDRDLSDRDLNGRNVAGDRSGDVEGYDTSGPTIDDAMTRSEERLNVGTQTRQTGRARLRKYVTTENVTQTVPVRREEVVVEREPIDEGNRDAATSGPGISEEEHVVDLHEEVPVVEKETVPVERVKLGTRTVTDETQVSEDVRSEQIETTDHGQEGLGRDADIDRR